MELIQIKHEESLELYRAAVKAGAGETVLGPSLFARYEGHFGELTIPEGIKELENGTLAGNVFYHTVRFPKSLKKLGFNLFGAYTAHVKIIYAGSSAEFMRLAKVQKERVYETDGYDKYPYYSGNSGWITYYYSFDGGNVREIEVLCEKDGVTLLYGILHRREDAAPKIKKTEN